MKLTNLKIYSILTRTKMYNNIDTILDELRNKRNFPYPSIRDSYSKSKWNEVKNQVKDLDDEEFNEFKEIVKNINESRSIAFNKYAETNKFLQALINKQAFTLKGFRFYAVVVSYQYIRLYVERDGLTYISEYDIYSDNNANIGTFYDFSISDSLSESNVDEYDPNYTKEINSFNDKLNTTKIQKWYIEGTRLITHFKNT